MKHTAICSLYAFALADVDNVERWLRIAALMLPIIVGVVQMLRRPPRREPKPRRQPKVTHSVLPLFVFAAAVTLFSGCAPATTDMVVRALGSDTNSVSVHVSSVWGQVDVRRNVPEPR